MGFLKILLPSLLICYSFNTVERGTQEKHVVVKLSDCIVRDIILVLNKQNPAEFNLMHRACLDLTRTEYVSWPEILNSKVSGPDLKLDHKQGFLGSDFDKSTDLV